MIFEHSSREPGMWRAWTPSGNSLEVTWAFPGKAGLGAKVGSHGRKKHLWIGLIWMQAFIPIGIHATEEHTTFDEPSWGVDLSKEFGLTLMWGKWRKTFDWLFRREALSWTYQGKNGQWHEKINRQNPFADRPAAATSEHPYTYVLRSGEKQVRTATITAERWVIGRRYIHRIGWPKERKGSIDVHFSGEVGERSGSWKGGTIGCSYDMLPGETPRACLRRMERDREFR